MIEPHIAAMEILKMPNTDQNKPGSKAGRRNRKVEQRSHKSDKQTSRVTEQRQEPEQEFAATPEFNEVAPINAAAEAADLTPLKTAEIGRAHV